MKKNLLYSLIIGLFGFITAYLHYPYTLSHLEGDALFLLTPEFLKEVLSTPPALLFFFKDFILQFYNSHIISAIFTAIPLMIITIYWGKILMRFSSKQHFCIIIPALFSHIQFYDMTEILWANAIFFVLWDCFFSLKNFKIRGTVAILSTFITYLLMPEFYCILFYIALLFSDWFYFKEKRIFYFLIPALLIIVIMPELWSALISFKSSDERYFFNYSETIKNSIYGYFLLLAILLIFQSKFHWKKEWIEWSIITILFISSFLFIKFRTIRNEDEFFYKLAQLADENQWGEILREIPYRDCTDQIRLKYALLAESEIGTLPDNILRYPIFSPDDFCFNHQYTPFLCNFNRQFYTCLGIPDEGFHQAFEYGTLTHNGICFKSLRNMIDCALDVQDKALAKKYINLLKKSSNHSKWLESREIRLKEMANKTFIEKENRSLTFIAAIPFLQEMAYLSLDNHKNKKIYDYLLCSILLEKKLINFASVLMEEDYYKNKNLPKAYAEAALLVIQKVPKLAKFAHIPNYVMQNLRTFVDLKKADKEQEILSTFGDTYWVYIDRKINK